MDRRQFSLASVAALFGAAAPTFAVAQAAERAVDANRVFQHLLDYLGLPAAQRTHFQVSYKLRAASGPTPPIWLASRGARRALTLDRDGSVLNPPTAAELQSNAQVIVGGPARMSSTLALTPLLTLGATIPAADAVAALSQANAAVGRFAGPMGMFAPHLNGVGFAAPRTDAANVVLANGAQAPLPYAGARFEFRPSAQPNARTLTFATPPTSATFLN